MASRFNQPSEPGQPNQKQGSIEHRIGAKQLHKGSTSPCRHAETHVTTVEKH